MSVQDARTQYCQFSSQPAIRDAMASPLPVISISHSQLLDFRSAFLFKFILIALVLLLPAGQAFAATINVDASARSTKPSAKPTAAP